MICTIQNTRIRRRRFRALSPKVTGTGPVKGMHASTICKNEN
jgi:hypothetical protein